MSIKKQKSIPAFGMLWFFLVLFCGRTLCDYLHLRLSSAKFIAATLICTITGIALGHIQWLPLSLDISLAVMPFFGFGNYLKNVDMGYKRIWLYLFCEADCQRERGK